MYSSQSRSMGPGAGSTSSAISSPLPQSQRNNEPHKAQFYVPTARQLEPGPKNPLILAIRSGIPDEVDFALPRLIVASYDQPDRFILEKFINSVSALLEAPTLWLDELERRSSIRDSKSNGRFEFIGEMSVDTGLEERAINSLLVLRNACFASGGVNSKFIASTKKFIEFLNRLFGLSLDFLLDQVLLESPEPIQHILVILQSIIPFIPTTIPIPLLDILCTTLPNILIHTRDLTILHLILPILISALLIPTLPPLPPALTPHLFLLLSLSPPPTILDLTLDLLISLTQTPGPARLILASPDVSAHLRHLMRMLEHGARQTSASFDPPVWTQGGMARNPASSSWAAEEASQKRAVEREEAQRRIETYGSGSVMVDVGDRPPSLPDSLKAKLYKMKEPARSISWMHESFVYSSMSQLLQVSFWHAYREFFTNSHVTESLLSASEVIKNVTVAFPGAAAKVWVDETGQQRFVIAGIGFRRPLEDLDKYACRWRGCTVSSGATNPAQLLSHLSNHHLALSPTSCAWASCTAIPCTTSHLLTHIPMPRQRNVPDMITSNPHAHSWLTHPNVTQRPAPKLPSAYKLHFTAFSTPTESRSRNPMGPAFLSALLIRNLAKVLRTELATARPTNIGGGDYEDAKRRKIKEDKFGLPIPDIILKEEEEEEIAAAKYGQEMDMAEGKLDWEERERARLAFEGMEERLGEVLAGNLSGLGQYLGEAWGW